MKRLRRNCLVLAALMAGMSGAVAQTEQQDLYELSLEELMNVSVVSASKEKERLFDAPVAVYSVSREEISRAGVLSIPEALRLIPGVIVRETTNGNYDVHLRGFDNTARYTYGQNQVNTITLVMINNRPVFNYNAGGTLWESLPVDIADIDRIEVVCGPSSPLFGPNAVSGVVNIITRDFKKDQYLASAQAQLTSRGLIGSAAVGARINDKLSAGITGNYQYRQRSDDEQYLFVYGGTGGYYVPSSEFRMDRVAPKGLDYKQSLYRRGANAYVSYAPTENIQIDYSGGIQAAEAQKVIFTTITPTSHTEANSIYSNLNTKFHDLTLRMSYVKGNDELHKLSEFYTTAYDYKIIDVNADYDIKVNNKLRIRPSVGYQFSEYSDLERITKEDFLGGLINDSKSMKLLSGSLRADYTPVKGLRLVGSARLDQFDVNDDLYLSYQFASTYAFNDKWLVRGVHGKSYSGIFYNMAFLDSKIFTSESSIYYAMGNTDVKAASNNLTELGLRGNILNNLQLDVTLFTQRLDNVSLLTYLNSQVFPSSTYPEGFTFEYHMVNNLDYYVRQNGMTVSVNWMPNKEWQIKPFVTLQQTEAHNFDFYNNPQQTGAPYNGQRLKHESTPAIFGGWYVNYNPVSKLNINTYAYYMGKQLMYHQNEVTFSSGERNIEEKLNLNAKVSYQLVDKFGLFIGGKNLLNANTREYFGTDRIGSQFFTGLSYNL